MKQQNSNLFNEIRDSKLRNSDLIEENALLKQELKNFKKHIKIISKYFDSFNETNESSLKCFFEDLHLYLETNFLDKLGDSFFVEDKQMSPENSKKNIRDAVISNSDFKGTSKILEKKKKNF